MRATWLLLALLAASYHTIQARPHRSMAVQDLQRVQPTPTSHTPECLSKQKAHSLMPTTLIKTFVLEWKKLSPDGGPYRNIITVNGNYPAPTIVANAGDRLVVKVVNKLNDSASIHWHGVYQNGTNEMDGVPGVTQYAIEPGTTFTYNFTLDVPGTYWYHSHFKCQYVDGLWGSLVVRDNDDHHHANPVIAMSDTYWNSSTNLLKAFLDPANADGEEPTPNACVMNGVGQAGICGSKKAKYTKVVLSQSEPCDCSNVTACRQKGGVTRVLNTAGFATFNISIDEHLMWMVAADSVPIKPTLPVGSLRLNTGQRYDVVLCRIPTTTSKGCSNNQPAWIRASMDQSTFPMDAPYPNVMGVLQYAGTHDDSLPKTKAWPYDQVLKIDARSHISGNDVDVIDPYHLQPLEFPKPPAATISIKLAIDIYADPNFNNSVRAHFNNMSQIELSDIKQPLLNLARQHKPYPTGKNPGPNIISVNYNDVVEVIINNHDEGEHPIHLHGQNFWITARGDGDFQKYNSNFTYTSRDTATVPGSGHLVLRFAALNRGIWLMHCHIDWHMAAGLGMIWSVGLGQ